MNSRKIIENTILFVKESLKNSEGGHDWFHVERVYNISINIANKENADLFVVALGALLHDIADSKFHGGDENIGPKKAASFLKEQQVADEIIQHVVKIIKNISFKGGNFSQRFRSLELDCIQDADRVDAIGAIGIARCFSYGGFKNRSLYKKSTAPSINHFHEKLLLLKDKMNTAAGKEIALERHVFMQNFLEQFYKEWEGK
jgi:uncharacterized protein